ncbi:MAG TPA: alpha-amylase family glycosyl hydrolase [Caulobacterales bacterium]|nr:alpha-amylase family glycosyl hydrolase [Caulobacterales bacterium]
MKAQGMLGALALALAACGGGGGTGGGPPPPVSLPSVDTAPVPAADPGSALPANWQYGGILEIYVRGYQDSDGDGVGDLAGVTQRLDYVRDLGVSAIWLMPITQSQDHDHGYAVSNYREVETQYGSLADLDTLVAQAHARGLGIILDYVMNHSAQTHPAFVNSSNAASNAFRDWYVWSSAHPTGWSIYGGDPWRSASTGWYFAPFSATMPDFNLRNAPTVAWHKDNLRFWLNRGVDGFRFDAVGNLFENGPGAWEAQPENYALMGDVRALVGGYANRYMVCEAPADPLGFGAGAACASAFAFGHHTDVVNAAKGQTGAVAALATYFAAVPASMATMVSNHDSFAGARLWDQLGGDVARYKLAAATYLLQPGVPFIYYGEEIGMSGAASLSGDAALRTPMSWTANPANAGFSSATPFRALSANAATNNVATEQGDPNALLNFYRSMLALRRAHASLARGSMDGASASGAVLSYRRTLGAEQTLVIVNYGSASAAASLSGLTANASYLAQWPSGVGDVTASGSGDASVVAPAQTVLVFLRAP